MSAVKASEAAIIRELLALIGSAQEILGEHLPPDGKTAQATINALLGLLDGPRQRDVCGRGEAFLLMRVPKNRKTFYGIVSEQDLPKGHREEKTARGPILMEAYLDAQSISADRARVEAFARNFERYGWCRVVEITVEIPDPPAAIPAEAAATHR